MTELKIPYITGIELRPIDQLHIEIDELKKKLEELEERVSSLDTRRDASYCDGKCYACGDTACMRPNWY